MAHGTSENAKANANGSATSVIHVQHQIRANASELQDYFTDLYSWEKSVSKEEQARKNTTESNRVPMPRQRNKTTIATSPNPTTNGSTLVKPDAHTYDKGYKKWESFDVDAALREADEDTPTSSYVAPVSNPVNKTVKKIVTKPKSTTSNSDKSREDLEREDGNAHYKQGDYVAAIKSYTRCLGFNSQNAVVLSNRAMAYLKNREYSSAEDDCTLALKVDPNHIKSLSRRGTARNALGKHRLALIDFEQALKLDPKNKQTLSQITATKELMRSAIKRAPKRTDFTIEVINTPTTKDATPNVKQPDATPNAKQPVPDVEEKENVPLAVVNAEKVFKPAAVLKEASDNPQPTQVSTSINNPIPRATATITLPKIPTKAPTTSYEFLRVWKSLTPKGDAERQEQLQQLRASYLRLLDPPSLPSVFKNSIESDLLCDIFSVFLSNKFQITGTDQRFVLGFVWHLSLVPRFKMTAMCLSEREKNICASVLNQLLHSTSNEKEKSEIHTLQARYGVTA